MEEFIDLMNKINQSHFFFHLWDDYIDLRMFFLMVVCPRSHSWIDFWAYILFCPTTHALVFFSVFFH